MMHFGAKDKGVPVALAEQYRQRYPMIVTHVYDADHGFNCDQRGVYDGYAAQRALERTHGLIDAVC
jgi:carboxymethylenebutenolidase